VSGVRDVLDHADIDAEGVMINFLFSGSSDDIEVEIRFSRRLETFFLG